jgi:hypothetical protein
MLKKFIVGAFVGLPVAAILMAGSGSGTRSDGAPVSSTGAPEETTCAMAGCHSDNSVNAGTAIPEIIIDGNPASYEPGKTYKITAKITDAEKQRFGFQLVALNTNNQNTGKLSLVDEERTQILKNYVKLTDREYVTYTYPGTDAVSPGKGEWSFLWTAPSQNVGAIRFYSAFASANNDRTDKGDHIYTQELQLLEPSPTGFRNKPEQLSFDVLTKVASQSFQIQISTNTPGKAIVRAYNLRGQPITTAMETDLLNGPNKVQVPWLMPLSYGVYLVNVQAGSQSISQKVIIQ